MNTRSLYRSVICISRETHLKQSFLTNVLKRHRYLLPYPLWLCRGINNTELFIKFKYFKKYVILQTSNRDNYSAATNDIRDWNLVLTSTLLALLSKKIIYMILYRS